MVCGFLRRQAGTGTAFALLGDIFEYWVGDDHESPVADELAQACQHAAQQGSTLYFMHGNRDFLVGQAFLDRCRMQALPDPWHGELFGIPTVLTHGDLLCTDDLGYQQFRRMSRSPEWQSDFLSKPLEARVAYAQHLRAESMKNKASARTQIMDVNADAVARAMDGRWPEGSVTPFAQRMIHGHTHRPAEHAVMCQDGHASRTSLRVVLPDWDFDDAANPRGYALQVDAAGIQPVAA